MALPSSGALSFYNVQTEMGGSSPIALTEYYGWSGLPSSGTIKVSDFYGKGKPSGTVTWLSRGSFSWVVPAGVTQVTLCMIGGGGAGAQRTNDAFYDRCGGGDAGAIVHRTVSVTAGTRIYGTVGTGGKSRYGHPNGINGLSGSASSFNGISAAGGRGGSVHGSHGWVHHQGAGARRSSCYGTFSDGNYYDVPGYTWRMWGGQAGFANGGSGGQAGYKGSGGGGGNRNNSSATNGYIKGGDGVVKITWG
jgi:hypothetical protein